MSKVPLPILEQTSSETTHKYKSAGCPHGQGLEILKKLITIKTDECILWPYARRVSGYGAIAYGGYVRTTHIIAWALANNQPVPPIHHRWNMASDLNICHTCDTPACINPRHLFRGTPKDNAVDKMRKGRSLAGERHPSAKLTNIEIAEIRNLDIPKGTLRTVAKRFNVSAATICRIRTAVGVYVKQKRVWKNRAIS